MLEVNICPKCGKRLQTPTARQCFEDCAGKILLRCGSHRARHKLFSLLADKPQGFYSWKTHATGGFYEVPNKVVPKALEITGITRASKRYEYHPCWNY